MAFMAMKGKTKRVTVDFMPVKTPGRTISWEKIAANPSFFADFQYPAPVVDPSGGRC
jgi:hypothetical protein